MILAISKTHHKSVILTTMEWKGPEKDGENGSDVPVTMKQRPQASPAPRPGAAPKESWFIAAVKPDAVFPQAGWPQPLYMVKEADPEGLWM